MKYVLSISLLLLIFYCSAQQAFEKTELYTGFSYGFPNLPKRTLRSDIENQMRSLKNYGVTNLSDISYTVSGVGPICFRVEKAITDRIGLGPQILFTHAAVQHQFKDNSGSNAGGGITIHSNNTDVNRYSMQCITVALRVNVHVGRAQKTDPYFGIGCGYNHSIVSYSEGYDSNPFIQMPYTENQFFTLPVALTDPTSPLYLSINMGIREYLSKNFAVFVEFGFDKFSYLQAGIVLK